MTAVLLCKAFLGLFQLYDEVILFQLCRNGLLFFAVLQNFDIRLAHFVNSKPESNIIENRVVSLIILIQKF